MSRMQAEAEELHAEGIVGVQLLSLPHRWEEAHDGSSSRSALPVRALREDHTIAPPQLVLPLDGPVGDTFGQPARRVPVFPTTGPTGWRCSPQRCGPTSSRISLHLRPRQAQPEALADSLPAGVQSRSIGTARSRTGSLDGREWCARSGSISATTPWSCAVLVRTGLAGSVAKNVHEVSRSRGRISTLDAWAASARDVARPLRRGEALRPAWALERLLGDRPSRDRRCAAHSGHADQPPRW